MHEVQSRMLSLHHLLTGGPDRLTRPDYPPRYLWGDGGLPRGHARHPSWLARLWQWTGL